MKQKKERKKSFGATHYHRVSLTRQHTTNSTGELIIQFAELAGPLFCWPLFFWLIINFFILLLLLRSPLNVVAVEKQTAHFNRCTNLLFACLLAPLSTKYLTENCKKPSDRTGNKKEKTAVNRKLVLFAFLVASFSSQKNIWANTDTENFQRNSLSDYEFACTVVGSLSFDWGRHYSPQSDSLLVIYPSCLPSLLHLCR